MPRRKKKPQKLPIVTSHWYVWGHGLFIGIPAIITMVVAEGPNPTGFGLGFGTCAACIGSGYVLRAIALRFDG